MEDKNRAHMALTERAEEVVHDTPGKCLREQLDRKCAVDSQTRRDSESQEANPLDVLEEVAPGNGRTWLLVLDRVGDVVVRDVGVGGLFLLDFLGGRRRRQGRSESGGLVGGRRTIDDGRHNCRRGKEGRGTGTAIAKGYIQSFFSLG